jgi:hypothetical protein
MPRRGKGLRGGHFAQDAERGSAQGVQGERQGRHGVQGLSKRITTTYQETFALLKMKVAVYLFFGIGLGAVFGIETCLTDCVLTPPQDSASFQLALQDTRDLLKEVEVVGRASKKAARLARGGETKVVKTIRLILDDLGGFRRTGANTLVYVALVCARPKGAQAARRLADGQQGQR